MSPKKKVFLPKSMRSLVWTVSEVTTFKRVKMKETIARYAASSLPNLACKPTLPHVRLLHYGLLQA